MADINFNGGKASNMADAKFEQDGINLRTLRRYSSILTANTISTVVSGITSGANISISGTSSAITISVNPNIVTTSINAGTILSAGTDLYNIFLTTADGNDITRVQLGLNTYTGGTANNPTVNISALTIDNIFVSGNSLFNSISATTYQNLPIDVYITGGTYSAGSTTFINNTGGTFTITGYFTGDTITASNWITSTGSTIEFGGDLTHNTTADTGNYNFYINRQNGTPAFGINASPNNVTDIPLAYFNGKLVTGGLIAGEQTNHNVFIGDSTNANSVAQSGLLIKYGQLIIGVPNVQTERGRLYIDSNGANLSYNWNGLAKDYGPSPYSILTQNANGITYSYSGNTFFTINNQNRIGVGMTPAIDSTLIIQGKSANTGNYAISVNSLVLGNIFQVDDYQPRVNIGASYTTNPATINLGDNSFTQRYINFGNNGSRGTVYGNDGLRWELNNTTTSNIDVFFNSDNSLLSYQNSYVSASFRYNTQIGFNNFYDDLFTRLLVKGATDDENYFGIKINNSASTTNFSVRNDGLVNTSNALIKNRSINLLGVETFSPGEIYALSVSANSISATTYYGDGSNLSGISIDNFYTTAVTLNNNIAYFNRNDLLSAYTLDLSIFSAATFTGTTNYYSKFNSGGTIQNGFIYDDGVAGISFKGNNNTSLAIISPTGFYYPSLNFYNNGGTSLGGITAYGGALYISGAGAPTTPLLVGSVVSMPYLSGNSLTYLNSSSQFQNLILGSGLTLTTGGTLVVTGGTGGGSQNLEQVLTQGNSTGGLSIVSPSGQNSLTVDDFVAGLFTTTSASSQTNQVYALDGQGAGLFVTNDINSLASRLDIYSSQQTIADSSTGNTMIIDDSLSNKGLVYVQDYSANFTDDSLITKRFAHSLTNNFFPLSGGTVTGNTIFTSGLTANTFSATSIIATHFEGVAVSSGIYSGGNLSISSGDNTKFDLSEGNGMISDYWTIPGVETEYHFSWSAQTGITTTYLSSSTQSFIAIDKFGIIQQYPTYIDNSLRRDLVILGQLGHSNKTGITNVSIYTTSYDSPIEVARDIIQQLKLVNEGNVITANGANLNINKSTGYLFGLGLNYRNDIRNPNKIITSAKTAAQFVYRTQTGGTTSNVTLIDPTNYDVGGVITALPGGVNTTTNQRIYLSPNNNIVIQYGQTSYSNLTSAIQGLHTESFIEYINVTTNSILIGILSIRKGATDLSSSSDAIFIPVSKFGESIGGAAGISTTNLQQAYDNSITPEIIINSTLDGFTIQNGTGNADNLTNLLEGKNSGGTTTSFIRANGDFSGNNITANTIVVGQSNVGNANSAETVNLSLYDQYTYTLTGNTTFTFSNNGNGKNWTIGVKQSISNSGLTATFTATTASVKWQNSVTPVMSPNTGATDIFSFVQLNSIIYGSYIQNF